MAKRYLSGGDIIDDINDEVVTYTYNSWGKLLNIGGSLASTVGIQNHLLYRGYYYDSETGMYYLQSRYYDPEISRFISRDDVSYHEGDAGVGANLYAYCNNNPVNNYDKDGHFGTPIQWACAVIGGIAGWYFGAYLAKKLGYTKGWKYWAIRAGAVVGGAIIGWFAETAILRLMTKFLLANPAVASKLPRFVLWFLVMGGSSGQIANEVFKNMVDIRSAWTG